MEAEAARARIFVRGLVQGVGFRWSMQQMARRFGVRGWVRNLPDGRVEAVIEGRRDRVEMLIEWAKRGPSGAEVWSVDIYWERYKGEFDDFYIRY